MVPEIRQLDRFMQLLFIEPVFQKSVMEKPIQLEHGEYIFIKRDIAVTFFSEWYANLID